MQAALRLKSIRPRSIGRRGLATACAARLLLACLERGLYPSWDAANPASAALAEKLGYRPAGAYVTYAVTPVRK